MLKLALSLLLGFLALTGAQAQNAIIGPSNAIICNQAATLAVGGTGNTQVVAALAGQRVFICGWHVTNTGATGTFTLVTGTGSNCAIGVATLLPAQNVTSSAPSADHIDYATIQSPLGAALCVNPSVNTIAAVIWFAQF